jgi:hypothetical protein
VTLIAITLQVLDRNGTFSGKLRLIGLALFTIICIAFAIENRHSKWKIIGLLLYFLFGVFEYYN